MTLLAVGHARMQHRARDLATLALVPQALAQQVVTLRDVGELPGLGTGATAALLGHAGIDRSDGYLAEIANICPASYQKRHATREGARVCVAISCAPVESSRIAASSTVTRRDDRRVESIAPCSAIRGRGGANLYNFDLDTGRKTFSP